MHQYIVRRSLELQQLLDIRVGGVHEQVDQLAVRVPHLQQKQAEAHASFSGLSRAVWEADQLQQISLQHMIRICA